MESFFESAKTYLQFSEESKAALTAILRRFELPKGYLLVKAETICNYIYYIESGITRTYYIKDGKDVTDWISTDKTFACSIVSFIARKPDRRSIELLENAVLWGMQYNDLEKLYQQYHEIERFGRLVSSNGLVQLQQRFDDLHFASAHDRYTKLMNSNPSIIQRVPLHMIASYLGITQETLSRVRSSLHTDMP